MFSGLRQSLALRLAVLYSIVFAVGAGLLIAAFIWTAERALEAPAQRDVEARAEALSRAYRQDGGQGLRATIDDFDQFQSYFVRVTAPGSSDLFFWGPQDWVQTEFEHITSAAGVNLSRPVPTLRIPKDALLDYAIAVRELPDHNMLQVGKLTDSRAVLLAPLKPTFIVLGLGSMIFSIGIGAVLALRATRPLRAVSETTHRILDAGDAKARVPTPQGSGELASLVRQLNSLLDRNAAHVGVLRETLDNIAHDMRTPLTRLRGTAELALHKQDVPTESRDALVDCVEQSDRLLHLLETLLDISAAEAGALKLNREQVDLRTVVERATELYKEVAEVKGIGLFVQLAAVQAPVDVIRFGQAVNNLVDNALKYTPNGGTVTLSTGVDGASAVVAVTDNGPGVAVSERDKIWRRLYRSDSSRSQRGLGLGLSLVKAIVEAHGGSTIVVEAPGGGARFELRVPLVEATISQ